MQINKNQLLEAFKQIQKTQGYVNEKGSHRLLKDVIYYQEDYIHKPSLKNYFSIEHDGVEIVSSSNYKINISLDAGNHSLVEFDFQKWITSLISKILPYETSKKPDETVTIGKETYRLVKLKD